MNDQSWLDVFLVFEEDKIFASAKSGAIGGTIYFQIGNNQFFPGRGWTDLVAAFVAAWLDGLFLVTTGTAESQRVHFLDGPFAVDISMAQKGLVSLSFVHNEESKLFTVAEVKHLQAHAVSIGRDLLLACQRKGWNNGDTEAIASLIQQM
jgi:hypothetical protein